jgi:CubicO group peptidase (beta-lactamase class C family)
MKIIVAFLLLFALPGLSLAQKSDSRLTGLETEIENLIKSYNAVGLPVAVIENNKTIYSKGFGFRDLEKKQPVTPETIFPIGSITKSFTASLLGILENNKALSIEDKPSLHIPKLTFYSDRMDNSITLGDLLSHRSGIGSIDGTYVLFPASARRELMGRLKYLKPNGETKNSFIYSNLGYIIAGTAIEESTGQSWEDNIRTKIFAPLKMSRSSVSIGEMTKTDNYSFGYGISNGHVEKVLFAELNNDKPGGAINSAVRDLANWMTVWLNNGTFQNKEIFPRAFAQQATSMKAIDNGAPPELSDPGVYTFGYGYGWKVNSHKGHYKVHHGGNVSGFSSQLVMYPTDKLGIVVLTNQHNSILPYIVADIISNRILSLKRTEWNKYPVKVDEISTVSKNIKGVNTVKRPTHELSDFCGQYFHPGFGTFEVLLKEGNLYIRFPELEFRLEHQYHDIFVMKAVQEIPQTMNPEFYLNFSLNIEGNVSSVSMNLQDEPVVFQKKQKG